MDRVETTGTVWLGLTLNCCRCHDHKFDPLKQKRILPAQRLLQLDRRDGGGGNDGPGLREARRSAWRRRSSRRNSQSCKAAEARPRRGCATNWRSKCARSSRRGSERVRGEAAELREVEWQVLKPEERSSENGAKLDRAAGRLGARDGGANPAPTTSSSPPTRRCADHARCRLEALPDDSLPNGGPGRAAEWEAGCSAELKCSAAASRWN